GARGATLAVVADRCHETELASRAALALRPVPRAPRGGRGRAALPGDGPTAAALHSRATGDVRRLPFSTTTLERRPPDLPPEGLASVGGGRDTGLEDPFDPTRRDRQHRRRLSAS